jgi:hypothetical protein
VQRPLVSAAVSKSRTTGERSTEGYEARNKALSVTEFDTAIESCRPTKVSRKLQQAASYNHLARHDGLDVRTSQLTKLSQFRCEAVSQRAFATQLIQQCLGPSECRLVVLARLEQLSPTADNFLLG